MGALTNADGLGGDKRHSVVYPACTGGVYPPGVCFHTKRHDNAARSHLVDKNNNSQHVYKGNKH